MHPEVVSDGPGTCTVCEMELVTAESQGLEPADPDSFEKPLVIPVTAALITGKRAVVFVEVPGEDVPTYEARQVQLGPRAGDWYLVNDGLAEGDLVVTNGNFKLDSALQIRGEPSMMAPEHGGTTGGAASSGHVHE